MSRHFGFRFPNPKSLSSQDEVLADGITDTIFLQTIDFARPFLKFTTTIGAIFEKG